MYGEQQDDSTFALDPRALLALAGGAVAGGIGKKYATKELSKGFQSSYDRTLARLQEAVAAKAAAREQARITLGAQLDLADPAKLAAKKATRQSAYDAADKAHEAALAEQMSEGLAAKQRLGDKNEWVNEMGLAVGGVPAAMLGYGIGSSVMRKKDDPNDPYRNPLR